MAARYVSNELVRQVIKAEERKRKLSEARERDIDSQKDNKMSTNDPNGTTFKGVSPDLYYDPFEKYGAECAQIEDEIQKKLDNRGLENSPEVENKIPENLGECADMLMNIKNQRTKLKRQDDELKSYAGILNDYVLDLLEKECLTSASGKAGCVTIGTKNRYSVADKEAFLKHVLETEGYDLIGKSVSSAAMSGRAIEGEEVPGVSCFEQTLIKFTKRKV